MSTQISNFDNTIDSRDVIARIEELEEELHGRYEELPDFEEWLEDNPQSDTLTAQEEYQKFKERPEFQEWYEKLADEGDDDAQELIDLKALANECEGYPDWRHGETLINEDYWVEYVEELCKDIGDLPKSIPPYIEIDWEKTADNIKVDYSEVSYGNSTYYIRR